MADLLDCCLRSRSGRRIICIYESVVSIIVLMVMVVDSGY